MIFITGAPRSGTSMTCQVLAAHGVDFGGPLIGPKPNNPYGFFEHRRMREDVVKPVLLGMDCDPLGQHPLPPRDWAPTSSEVASFRRHATDALGGADAYKGVKLVLFWRLAHAAFPGASWVMVWRESVAVAESCQRTTFMRHHDTVDGWLGYVKEMQERMEEAATGLRERGADVWGVEPDPRDPGAFGPMVTGLGLEWSEEATRNVLHPEVWGRREAPAGR